MFHFMCINYSRCIQKIKNNESMKAINYARFKLEEKATRSVKKNKTNFIDVTGDKFAMSIRGRKLIISFCKKLLSCRNIFSYLCK